MRSLSLGLAIASLGGCTAPPPGDPPTNGPLSGGTGGIMAGGTGGHIFPGFDINHSYTDCDVFVSIPKMKEHHWFGATLSMKNC